MLGIFVEETTDFAQRMAKQTDLDDLFGSEDDGVDSDGAQVTHERPKASGVLAFHNGTEEAMYHYVKMKATEGDPASILRAIDDFCYTQHWMMHIGDQKLHLLSEAIRIATQNSTTGGLCTVELGAYCGYSAIYLASNLSRTRGDHLYSIEINPRCVTWTKRMVDLAGLTDMVTVIESSAANNATWCAQLHKPMVDLLFIDHDKAQYLPDLLALERALLLHSGTVVVADNVLSFNTPLAAYLEHVRNPAGPYASSTLYAGLIEYAGAKGETVDVDKHPELVDGVEISVFR